MGQKLIFNPFTSQLEYINDAVGSIGPTGYT